MTRRGWNVWAAVFQESAAAGFRSRPARWDSSVHGAVLPPLQLLPLPGLKDGLAEGPHECGLRSAGAHDRGVQEPGQEQVWFIVSPWNTLNEENCFDKIKTRGCNTFYFDGHIMQNPLF